MSLLLIFFSLFSEIDWHYFRHLIGWFARLWIFFLIITPTSFGAIDRQSLPKKLDNYLTHGAFVGGSAGRGFSLINIDLSFGKSSRMERMIIDIGDEKGVHLKGSPAYYHIEVDEKKQQILIDLAQVQRSLISENDLRNKMKTSPYIELKNMYYDPQDKEIGIVLRMKVPLKVEVFNPRKGQNQGRLVMDLLPNNTKKENKKEVKKRS